MTRALALGRDPSSDELWNATLDAFSDRLAAQRTALDAGDLAEIEPFKAPPDLPLLPEHLAGRAGELLAWAAELEAQLSDQLDATGHELVATMRAARPAPAATPRYVDQHA